MTDQDTQVTPDNAVNSNNANNSDTTVEETRPAAKFGSDREKNDESMASKDDLDKVLKQNQHGQQFIETLKAETSELREQVKQLQQDLSQSRTIDDLLSEIRQQNESYQPESTTPQVDENKLLEKLRSQVFADLSAQEQAKLQQENWQRSKSLLQERHGDGWASYVDSRASELDMTIEDLESLATTSPKAFIELVSPGQQMNKGSVPPTQADSKGPSGPTDSFELRYRQIARLRKDLSTPEGREANQTWNDPQFQAEFRRRILKSSK